MVIDKKWLGILVVLMMLLISACGGSTGENTDSPVNEETAAEEVMADESLEAEGESVTIQANETFEISGSNILSPLTEAVVEQFGQTYTNVKISVSSSNEEGFEPFCSGETSFHQAARVIKEEEKPSCEENMIEYKELEVAGGKDGTSQPLYLYVSLDALSGMEGYEFVSLYLQEAPKLAEQLGYTPLPQATYDEGLMKLDE
ncbi:hypothetical protein [Cohnella sp.]|uniref:hypothetical protein n=1 Tax=Cohnella sp. TaxID=1883426 RepID=UPI00356A7AF8